jgi:Putative arginyl-tRNA:protein arginylyltransferase
MKIVGKIITEPSQCGYLPDRDWRFEYEYVSELNSEEYLERINKGWRKYGYALFKPACVGCMQCEAIRIVVNEFRPNRSQIRVMKANTDVVIRVGQAEVDRDKFLLYMEHHWDHHEIKGWPRPSSHTSVSHLATLCENPFPIQEWCHYVDDQLVGVLYADPLPDGFSAVYSFYDPTMTKRGLGTWMILSLITKARELGLPYIYLGYYVRDCRSMAYKKKFVPNEILQPDGQWRIFQP